MKVEELNEAVRRIRWRHRIDPGHGITTPGNDRTVQRFRHLKLPASLEGKTVLDVGAWDGFYSFEAERRGAERVVAPDTWGQGVVRQEGFNLAHRVLGSRVEAINMDVLDVRPERLGTLDIVLFLGVLYHLRHPLLALERLHAVTGELLIVESHVDVTWRPRPVLTFYPGSELNNDPTNWWGPNPEALRALIRTAGFRGVTTISSWPGLKDRFMAAARAARHRPSSFRSVLNWKRMVVHARP